VKTGTILAMNPAVKCGDDFWLCRCDDDPSKGQVAVTWLEETGTMNGYRLDMKEEKLQPLSSMFCPVRIGISGNAFRLKAQERETIMEAKAFQMEVVTTRGGDKVTRQVLQQRAAAAAADFEELLHQAVRNQGVYVGDVTEPEYTNRRFAIEGNSSGEVQLLDTHVNGPDKAGKRAAYADLQHAQIKLELEKYDGDLQAIQQKIEAGEDPRLLPTWKSPVEMEIKQPSRGECILLGRQVRARLFDTETGAQIIADGYYSNGLLPKGCVHGPDAEYLYYDERIRERAGRRADAKEKKEVKKKNKIAKEKEEELTFAKAMADCGIWLADEHE